MILLILWQTSKHMADGGVPQMVVTLGLEHVWQGFRYMVRLEDRALQKLKALGLWGIGAILFIKPFPHDDALHKPRIMLLKALSLTYKTLLECFYPYMSKQNLPKPYETI